MFEFFALMLIIILILIVYYLLNKLEKIKIKQYILNKDIISSDFLEFSSTNDLVKELEKRKHPPLLIIWLDYENEENKVNYFVFKKNLTNGFVINVLKKIIKDVKNSI